MKKLGHIIAANMFISFLFVSHNAFAGSLDIAERHDELVTQDRRLVFGKAQQTYQRFEDDRNQVIEALKNETDEDALKQCWKKGCIQTIRLTTYTINETHHGGFKYLATIKMSAKYDCLESHY